MNAAEQLTFLDAAERCGDEDEQRRKKFEVALFEYREVYKPMIFDRLRVQLPEVDPREIHDALDEEIGMELLNSFGAMTYKEIGAVFGISRQRAEIIGETALRRLQHPKRAAVLREFSP